MAVYGPVRHKKNSIWTSDRSVTKKMVYGPQTGPSPNKYYMDLRSFGPYNIFLVTNRPIFCHMTLSAMNYLLCIRKFCFFFSFPSSYCFTLYIYIYYYYCISMKGPSWSWSYGSWISNYLCNQYISPLTVWVRISLSRNLLDTNLWDKVCQCLAAGRWFSPVSSTNKTNRHDMTEIMLKVVLNTINLTYIVYVNVVCFFFSFF